MSEKILSVIIPSYNSKPYLDKCLASLIVPDRMDQMDIIVVTMVQQMEVRRSVRII